MNRYRLIAKKGEGTFSEVLKAQSIKTSRYVAVKAMKQHFSTVDKVNNLREIQALRRLSPHPNIVSLLEVLYDRPSGRLALVFELMSMNLYELIRGRSHFLDNSLVRIYLFQTLASVAHMHERGIFHRDIKPENILIESSYDVWTGLKLADFGSCRGCYSKHPFTEYISTRWYRAPECLLTDGYYGPEMDVWGIGCVFYEISCLAPLFPGENEKDQLKKIHSVLGTPDEETLSFFRRHASKHVDFNFPPTRGRGLTAAIPNHIPVQMVDLLVKMLRYHPRKRISAKDALMHPYFADLRKQRVPAEMKPYYRFAADGSRLEDDAKPPQARAAMEVSRLAVTQNQVWASDTSQFGYRMLEKMGWSEGKGLGKNEQGEETHINVMRKVGKDGIGSKKDATGNNTLTSGFLDFHRILQHLSATHKDGSPQVDLDAAADSEAAAAAVPLDLARIAKAARSAAEREAPSLPPSTEGSGASRVSEEALLRAMAGAAERVGTAPQLKATKRRMRKRLREGDDGEAAGGKRAASADDEAIAAAGARVRQAYRRAIRTKNVKGYSSHDLSAILGDARGAFRAPTTEERQTSNAATRLGEGLDASAVAAAEAVVAVGGGVL